MRKRLRKQNFSASRIILLGFALVILGGTLVLLLPWSARQGMRVSFLDALFTATSAVCVTGLVVYDTASCWSGFGQGVLLLLIQIGGLGVVTVAVAIELFSGRRINLRQRSTMQEALSAPHLGGIVGMTGFLLRVSVIIELLGAALLAFVFCRDFGFWQGLWYALFHSVSAFCNAGFDLMGAGAPFSSLTGYAAAPGVIVPVMLLIVVGGIGFFTWDDVRSHGLHLRRYRLQSRVILALTGILILGAALFFFFFEFAARPMGERVLQSLFCAVSPRTAGFNTVDTGAMSESGKLATILLMLVGGSPGSTAGGMKTTTLAVFFAAAFAVFRQKKETVLVRREIADEVVRRAVAIVALYGTLFLLGGIVIAQLDAVPLLDALFEAASAIGTVGLSTGITPRLCAASRLLLIGLMFLGRVGGLTLVFAALSERQSHSRYPRETITVG